MLNAVRVSSDNVAALRTAIEATVADFEPLVATMCDRGRAGTKAIAGCQLEAVSDLVCHFHLPETGLAHGSAAGIQLLVPVLVLLLAAQVGFVGFHGSVQRVVRGGERLADAMPRGTKRISA